MWIATQLSERGRRVLGGLGVSVLVAVLAAVLSVSTVSLFPPTLHSRQLQIGGAATHVLIDSPQGTAVDPELLPQQVDSLTKRAELLGRTLATPRVLAYVGRRLGVSPDRIGARARTTAAVQKPLTEPDSERRANEILHSGRPYQLELQARPTTPILDIYAQAPSTDDAERLANAAVSGLGDYLRALARRDRLDSPSQARLHQLGRARGGVVNSGASLKIAALAFVAAFSLAGGAVLLVGRLRRGWPAAPPGSWREDLGPDAHSADDWPRTTRVLPWMFAAFLALLWLVPFDAIQLKVSLPVDLKLDRLLLPFIVVTWLLALIVGGRGAPRVRLTWIHATVAAFLLCAFLSVALDAGHLNQTLELDDSIKRVWPLVGYVSLLFLAASIVRHSEVRAFLKLTLWLAVICAVGIIWEYRFKYNVFYDLSGKLLPGIFEVGTIDSGALDDIGRPVVTGPGAVGLEAVAMLSMALPIALVGILHAGRWRERILYGLAGCLLLAAIIATYRKSALLAPAAVVLTILYFRRRELLKLAPLGMVLLVVVHLLSPGAIGSTVSQLDTNRLGVATVSDRTIDYDAVRPDVWTHVAFGRGWGSYSHTNYRILDSEILQRLVETGVIGLLAYLLMGISVIAVARATIASRDPRRAPLALIGAAAAAPFIAVSFLFDAMSFPHVPYIFLYLAGLVAIVVERRPTAARRPRAFRAHDPPLASWQEELSARMAGHVH